MSQAEACPYTVSPVTQPQTLCSSKEKVSELPQPQAFSPQIILLFLTCLGGCEVQCWLTISPRATYFQISFLVIEADL